MSQENIELIREMFRRAEQGDRGAVYDVLAPDVTWEAWTETPAADTYRGPDGVKRFFRDWVDAFEDYWAEATEFVDAGQHVVVGVRHRGRGKASGIEVDMPQFQVYTLRDGRIIRYRGFRTRAEALGAAGIPD